MMRGDISRIKSDSEMYTAQKMRFGYWRYGNEGGGVGHTGRISRGAEDGNAIGRGAEGFNTLIGLLTVIEGRSHTVEAKVWIGDKLWRAPLGSGYRVVGFDVAIH